MEEPPGSAQSWVIWACPKPPAKHPIMPVAPRAHRTSDTWVFDALERLRKTDTAPEAQQARQKRARLRSSSTALSAADEAVGRRPKSVLQQLYGQ
jgi:hypothetical protein